MEEKCQRTRARTADKWNLGSGAQRGRLLWDQSNRLTA